MLTRQIALGLIGCTMLTAAAIAQTGTPSPGAAGSAPAAESPRPPENNLAGQGRWRASKLMGVDIYGPDNTKVGDVTEVLFDRTGKVETVTVGVGGFLGIGAKDVAIPFEQISWSDQPMAAAAPAPAPSGSTSPSSGASSSGGMGSPSAPARMASAAQMFPDHGKITMTKDQLQSAPSVIYNSQ